MSLKILLAEDEPRVQSFIKRGLEQSGMTVDCVNTIEEIEVAVKTSKYDVLILDRLLRNQDAIHIIPRLRRQMPQQKIMVLSALSEVYERVNGLERGADDYLGKPFHIEELVARLRTLGRQVLSDLPQPSSTNIEFEDLKIDLQAQRVSRQGQPIDLTAKEFKILVTLAGHPYKVFTRAELLQKVWDFSFDPESNVVDVAMGRLKRKLNLKDLPPLVHAKRGVGYSLSVNEQTD